MKHNFKFILALFFFTSACATGVIKGDWTKSLLGKTGYLREPSQIIKDDKKKWSHFSEYKRCEPVEIVEVRTYGKDPGLVVKQNGKLFYLYNARTFVNEFKANPTEEKLNEFMASSKDEALGEKKEVKLTTGTHDSHELQCKNTYWAGMTAQQLLFVKGKPDSSDRTTTKTGFKEQWFYNQKDQQQSFELENGVLTMWQD